MNEVASLSEVTVTFLGEGVACFCLVGSIVFHVDTKFMRSVGELTLLAIAAETLFSEVFA